ncbi:hypothetical protein GCM10022215_33430 [Nocardioides fonticola]|uniref:Uncharacterized protein n=1 Tax=Nocardioides fonticola TaxID=450363 RepID=A0ABP7XT57_9ACTN
MAPLPARSPRRPRARAGLPAVVLAAGLAAGLMTGLAPSAHGDGLSGTETTDPRGDVVTHGRTTGAQRRTVDLRTVGYTNNGTTLTIVSTVVDLAKTPGREFVDTVVRQRVDGTKRRWVLSSQVGVATVMIGTGSAYYRCEGATASVDENSDTVAQELPLSCLSGFTRPKLRTTASVVRRNGAPITEDRARGTRFDVTSAG